MLGTPGSRGMQTCPAGHALPPALSKCLEVSGVWVRPVAHSHGVAGQHRGGTWWAQQTFGL